MKKLIVVIFFLCFFFCGSVEAAVFSTAEKLDGIYYVKFDGSTYYYKYAFAIRNAETGNIAFCIQPFSLLIDGANFSELKDSNTLNISSSQWERIKLIAYYGYSYGNHTDSKWISITQMLIWRTIDPGHSFEWIDGVKSRNVIYPYEKEISEIESLIKNHNTKPKISNIYTMSIDDTLEIIDSNNVLKNYSIVDSNINSRIENNKLIINSGNNVGEYSIRLVRNFSNNSNGTLTGIYYNSASQSVIERGSTIEPSIIDIKINVKEGTLNLHKIDSITHECIPLGSANLIDSVFDIYDEKDNVVGSIELDNNCVGRLEHLKYGKYYVKERSSGEGYTINENKYDFVIDDNSLEKSIDVENEAISSVIRLIKYYGTSNDYKYEKDVSFEVYDSENHLVFTGTTNEDGFVEFKLYYGKYRIKQTNGLDDYSFVDEFEIDVNGDDNFITKELYDTYIEVPNAYIEDSNVFDYLLTLIMVCMLAGVIYAKNI